MEARHSGFLGFLLDPQKNRGLGDAFARRLYERVLQRHQDRQGLVSPIDLDVWDMTGADVRRERQNIDILFEDQENKFVALIENKVGSGEHSGQLKRYLDNSEALSRMESPCHLPDPGWRRSKRRGIPAPRLQHRVLGSGLTGLVGASASGLMSPSRSA